MPIAHVLPYSAALSLAVFAIQRALHPLYGSVPTKLHLLKVVAASSVLGVITPKLSLENGLWLTSVILMAAPQVIHRVAAYTADWKDAEKGAPASLASVLIPLFYAGVAVINGLAVRFICLCALRDNGLTVNEGTRPRE
jgi:hypothetical protein